MPFVAAAAAAAAGAARAPGVFDAGAAGVSYLDAALAFSNC